MKQLSRRCALPLAGVVALLLPLSGHSRPPAKTKHACVSESLAAVACAGLRPVPSLDPGATNRLWRRLVSTRQKRTFHAAGCRPLRAVFYAASDWLRLATKLAAEGSPCAQYYISIPPLAGDKTKFRPDQAWRIRAIGPNFHALAEVHAGAWRAWVKANNSTWYQAGVEARRRMAAAGYDVSLGDSWIVNELSSAVRRGIGTARAEAREFVHGLHDGDGSSPPAKGGVFNLGFGQTARDLGAYKAQVEGWLEDAAFWQDMSRYVRDWSQELYGDPRNYAVASAPAALRRDYLNDYLQHHLVHARLGPETGAARSYLESAESPLANGAWNWDYGFGWTMVSAAQMEDYISGQVYALRHFGAASGQPEDHWGFAWAPRNTAGMPAADFKSQTNAILDRLATAIRDSGEPLDPSDPGIGACAPAGQNLWCKAGIAGAWFNPRWKTFLQWGEVPVTVNVSPASASLAARATQLFSATALDVWGNTVSTAAATWSVRPASAGVLSTTTGSSTTFTASPRAIRGGVVATIGGMSGSASLTPVLRLNKRPWIRSARFIEARGREKIRLLACDDSPGRLVARIEQKLSRKRRLVARGAFLRLLGTRGAGCRTYAVGWRLRGAFAGSGRYTIVLRLRDSRGTWGKAIQNSRLRT